MFPLATNHAVCENRIHDRDPEAKHHELGGVLIASRWQLLGVGIRSRYRSLVTGGRTDRAQPSVW